jgi:hypothetical protein
MISLRRLASVGLALRELRRLRTAAERIATALELQNAHAYPQLVVSPDDRETEVTFVDAQHQAALMEIEMRLTAAKGIPPTEDEILAMWEIEHQQPPADQEEVPRA